MDGSNSNTIQLFSFILLFSPPQYPSIVSHPGRHGKNGIFCFLFIPAGTETFEDYKEENFFFLFFLRKEALRKYLR